MWKMRNYKDFEYVMFDVAIIFLIGIAIIFAIATICGKPTN